MPWGDWQFWLVTLASAWGLSKLVRQLLPKRKGGAVACSSCAVGAAATREAMERRDTPLRPEEQP